MTGLSVCALAHDTFVDTFEENGLELFLDHTSDNADEVVVIDTSRDGDIKDRLGYIASNVRIIRSVDNLDDMNFSLNRNQSLSEAKYDNILVLDPDERITDWRIVHSAIDNNPNGTYHLEGVNIFYGFSRIMRNVGRSPMARLFSKENRKYVNKVFETLVNVEEGCVDDGYPLFCGYEHHKSCDQFLSSAKLYDSLRSQNKLFDYIEFVK